MKSMTDKIRMLCQLNWKQIDSSPKETVGYEPLPRKILSRTVPTPVPVDRTIIAFRFGGGSGSQNTGRMVGFRESNTFYVLFVDSKLDLYAY
jgi:hypothetical protein